MSDGRRPLSGALSGAAVLLALAVAVLAVVVLHHGQSTGHKTSAVPPLSFPDAPKSQRFSEFGRCRAAPRSRYLPLGAECVTVARADVDGDGSADLIVLYTTAPGHSAFTLVVFRARGGELRATVQADMNATIALAKNVIGNRRGAEVCVHDGHVTTDEGMAVYAFNGRSLQKAGELLYGGQDAGILFGFTCVPEEVAMRIPTGATPYAPIMIGRPPMIIQHEFDERTPFRGIWDRTDRRLTWVGAKLQPTGKTTVRATPTPAQVGVHC